MANVIMRIVASVSSKKIPDLLESMEKTRTMDGARMDALALRLEGDILAVAGRLQSQCQEMFRCEGQDAEVTDTFDDLWFQLYDLFKKFMDHCEELGIHFYDVCCLMNEATMQNFNFPCLTISPFFSLPLPSSFFRY